MNGQETGLEPGLVKACARAGQINEDNLRRLLADNRDTVYGKKYGFGSMETSAEYRKRVRFLPTLPCSLIWTGWRGEKKRC